ncbi:similar to D-lactate dehydrogenase (cytochrome) [Botrytis cinerea T4]|uniref:D-lactate dehydrogenase (cytochrome) n=1 Tax=Botryotinia fuckeliana (strain T4) TaxID=999810 RepID=G2YCA8_BOTF4|nr:similar to D-lactate dehydrogenase (cytochrome) [Botrytis cinerea T4]
MNRLLSPISQASKHSVPAKMPASTSALRQNLAKSLYGRSPMLRRRFTSNSAHASHNGTAPPATFSKSTVLLCSLASATASLCFGYGYMSYKSRTDQKGFGSSIKYAEPSVMLQAIQEIANVLGDESISYDEDELLRHSYSEWSTSNSETRPLAVVYPKDTGDVVKIAKICSKHKVPMIPFGAGSSVEGHISTPCSGLSIDFVKMDKIIQFHPDESMDVVVQPAVNWVNLNEQIKDTGLFLPLDPSPTAHIGGMVSTNCSGTNAMRYGTMKDWVINLTVVLADGTVIKTRRRPRKTSAGYNLTSLFVGAEGTLGLITEITLKLAVVPDATSVAVVTFPSVVDAATAASKIIRTGIPLAAMEIMDEVQMQVINKNGGTGGRKWEERPTLFFKFSGTEQAIKDHIQRVQTIAKQWKGGEFQFAKTEEDKIVLWSARKEALWAMLAQRPPGTEIWSTDCAVPMSRLAEIIDISKAESGKLGLFSSVLGHVGDGNFHQAVMYNPKDPIETAAVKKCVYDMLDRALEMEGTSSGEHGIGLGKKDCLMKELGLDTITVMKKLKHSLDPNWLLNPGKIFNEP